MDRLPRLLLFLLCLPIDLGAQSTPSNLTATVHPDNVLRYNVQFSTAQSARGFVEYVFWDGLDSIHTRTNSSDSASSHQLTMLGLIPQMTYRYRAVAWDATGCYPGPWDTLTTSGVPAAVTVGHILSVTGTAGFPLGYILSNTAQGDPDRYLQIHDRQGRLRWYQRMPGIAAPALDGPCQHFSYQPETRTILVTECDAITEFALDGTILRSAQLTSIAPGWMAHHDVTRLPDDHWLVLAARLDTIDMSSVGGDPNALVVGPGILDIDPAGNLAWSWSAFDHLDPLNSPAPGGAWVPKFGPQAIDWLSANSLMQDTDGRPMISLGGTSQVLKLDRSNGSTVWTTGVGGNIQILPPDSFMHQHAIRPGTTGYYLTFDNQSLSNQSRWIEWKIDFSNVTPRMQVQRQYLLPVSDYCPVDGNVDLIPGGSLVVGSSAGRTITETSSAGSVLWRAQLDSSFYRAYWVDDFYPRLHPTYAGPAVVCAMDSLIPLQASIPGGVWSGLFVQGDSFNAAAAGFGLFAVTYKLGPEEFTQVLLVDPSSNCGVGILEPAVSQIELNAFPNPTSDDLNLAWTLSSPEYVSLELASLDGRLILRQDLGKMPPGQHTTHLLRAQLGSGNGVVVMLRTRSGKRAHRVVILGQ